MKKNQIDIITLGCSKNLVDSESLMRLFQRKGFVCKHDAERVEGEYVVINTCGFIEDAKQESIDTILEFAQAREEGLIAGLYVMGCLSQRYQKELEAEIPQVDKYYGKFNYKQLLEDLPAPTQKANEKASVKQNTTPSHYSYVKISEGCDRNCAYCAIPIITGKHVSRPKEEILDEVRALVAEGVKWIRLHYAYPNQFPMELLDVMRRNDNVCKYLDIALQHISDRMLDRMRRNTTKQETMHLIEKLREAMPGIHLRTTLMVGFPGETDEDFNELMEFTRWARFERMGAFAYSEEEGTYSAEHYEDDVPKEVKDARLSKLMRLQQGISAEVEAEKIGKTMKVIIDRKEGDYYVGRTEFCSPEVDPEVLIPVANRRLRKGCFYNVKITGAEEFDLYGEVIDS